MADSPPPRKLGRKPLAPGEISVKQSCSFSLSDYDRLYATARQRRLSVPEAVRQAVRRFVRTDEPEP